MTEQITHLGDTYELTRQRDKYFQRDMWHCRRANLGEDQSTGKAMTQQAAIEAWLRNNACNWEKYAKAAAEAVTC